SSWVYYRGAVAYPRRRAEQMREAAASLGLVYRPEVPPEQLELLRQMPPFSRGRRHRGWNLLAGTYQGVPLCLVDYYYMIGSGRTAKSWWQTVVLIPGVSRVPDFQLMAKGFFNSVAALLDSQDIRFPGCVAGERFSRHYILRSPKEQAIHA